MNEAQLVKAIKVCIEKGDKAKQKSDDFYIAAGQHLKTLKEASPNQAAFLRLVQEKIGLGKSRTYEPLQIADGTKTANEIAVATTERSKKHREL